jgi:hypothetical protein
MEVFLDDKFYLTDDAVMFDVLLLVLFAYLRN